ncbi:hypothetical protein EZI54_22185 [Marinobacter halodurans]|uniref:TRAP transporter small permease subunit n=1 Tax=Marinobacter halodurans TaxID=2528979 RepID=A0ABY1ZDY5_9GAMM|nr:ABZJ_00895 family protein [Marinobacter halodurans]TBW47804.1 hypothetical protein EZI54_22185 [Marinobacter halodurans]
MITRTILIVAALYTAIQFCHLAAQSLLGITIPSAVQFGYAMASAAGGAFSFVDIQRRVPGWREAMILSVGSLVAIILVSIVMLLVVLQFTDGSDGFRNFIYAVSSVPAWLMMEVLMGVSVLQFAGFMLVFRKGARAILARSR